MDAREREGLIHYIPSNGTEGDMFFERCSGCRHYSEDESGAMSCAFGVVEKLLRAMWEPRDSDCNWYDPDVLQVQDDDGRLVCPARCRKFTPRNDPA